MNQARLPGITARPAWIALFVVLVLVMAAGGYWYYCAEAERIRQEEYTRLAAIAHLKAGQIGQWRQERLDDVECLAGDTFFGQALVTGLRAPETPGLEQDLRKRLALEQKTHGYADVLVSTPDGEIRLAASETPVVPTDPATRRAIEASLAGRQAALGNLFRGADGIIYIDVVDPVLDNQGNPLAVIILRSAAGKFLYPLIQSWPTPSPSAETLLVQRTDGEIIFQNELRHRTGTALTLRQPMTQTGLPAVQAVLGKTGLFQGKDYRGVEVLADLRPIPDSPWFMVAKMDAGEILAEAAYRARVIALFVVAGLVLAGVGIGFATRQQRAGLYKALYDAEQDKRQAQELFRTTLFSIGDAVISTDQEGRIQMMNEVAETLTGWKTDEAQGRPLIEAFHIINALTRRPVDNPVAKVLTEGRIVGMANHTILIARDGAERQIADSAAPIRDAGGSLLGVVLVFHDVTEDYRMQERLRQERDRAQGYLDTVETIIVALDTEGQITTINRKGCQLFGYEEDELIGKNWFSTCLTQPEGMEKVYPVFVRLMAGELKAVEYFENSIIIRSGRLRLIAWHNALLRDEQGRIIGVLSSGDDITEGKRVEEKLKETNALLLIAGEKAKLGGWSIILEENRVTWSGEVSAIHEMPAGYSPSLQDGFNFYPPEWHGKITNLFNNCALNGIPYDEELEIITASKKRVWVRAIGEAVRNNEGKIFKVQGALQDISEQKRIEDSLRVSEEKFSAAFKFSTYAKSIVRLSDGLYVDINDAFLSLTGFTRQEIINSNSIKMNLWVDPEAHNSAVKELFSNGIAPSREIKFRTKTGVIKDVLFSSITFKVANEAYSLTNLTDITEKKQAEEAVKEIRQRLEFAIQGGQLGLWDWNPQSGAVVYSDFWAQMLEYTSGEIEPTVDSFKQNIHPEDMLGVMERLTNHIEGRLPIYESEHRMRTKSGKWKWVLDRGKIAECDNDGRPVRVTGVIADITERKLAEEKIREKDIQFRKLSANLPDLIFQFTRRPDGTYCVPIASAGIKNIFGCTPEDVLDDFAPIGRVIHPGDAARVISDIEYSAEHLSYFTCEFRVQIPGKEIQWIYSRSLPEKLPDGSITWYGFNADITERKQAEEELKQRMEELELWQEVTLGREGRVMELKKEVNELLARLGQPPRYESPEAQAMTINGDKG